eukprot:199607-Pleurochrysis_carterae.AAC.1
MSKLSQIRKRKPALAFRAFKIASSETPIVFPNSSLLKSTTPAKEAPPHSTHCCELPAAPLPGTAALR